MARSELDIVAGNLKAARYALTQDAIYAQQLDMRLPVEGSPNGWPARVHIGVGPSSVLCRVTGADDRDSTLYKASKYVLDFAIQEMRGWEKVVNSGGGRKTCWKDVAFWLSKPKATNRNFNDLLQAVSSARAACVTRSRFKQNGSERWQVAVMENGAYPVGWTVESADTEVVIRLKNKGSDTRIFLDLAQWTFEYIKSHNSDSRESGGSRGNHTYWVKVSSDTMRLEVPCR